MIEEQSLLSSTPLVSIIVPVYKVQEYLSKCLESLISQTYKFIDIVVVDDGSPDNSLSICRRYADKDSRIQVITQDNKGVTAARQNGFLHARGDLIMFVDADDYVSPNIVEVMLQAQQKYQVNMVCCQYYDVKDGREISSPIRPACGYYDRKRIEHLLATNFLYDNHTEISGMPGYLCTKLLKKDLVHPALEAGRNLIHSEDQIGLLKTLYDINSMYVLQDPLYYYVMRQGQATRSYRAEYWRNFELLFSRMIEIDRNNYLKEQIPYRAIGIINGLVKMEFTNGDRSFCQQYASVKRNFSDTLCALGTMADTSGMKKKKKVMHFLQVHHAFFLYGIIFHLSGFVKKIISRNPNSNIE